MSPVYFQGKPFTVIQFYTPTINAEEADIEQFYGDIQDLLELTTIAKCPFQNRGL